MHRGTPMRRHSQTRGSPTSMRPTSIKGRRSYSPIGRRHSPKRGRPFLKKTRIPGRMASQHGRSTFGHKKRVSSSPARRHSLSPRRKSSPIMKRRSSSPNRQGSNINKRTLSSNQHSPSKSSVRHSVSPRRPDSRNHSNVRSHSSGGREFRKSSPRRPSSRSPVSLKKQRKLSPRWHSSTDEIRKKDTSHSDDMHFKDGRNTKAQHHDSRVDDNMLSPARSRDFSAQRDDPPFNTGDIDERFQRQTSSPYKKEDRFIDDGAFRDNCRGYAGDISRDQGGSEMHSHNFMSGAGGGSRSIDDDYIRRDPGNPIGENLGMGKLYTQEELKKITVDIFRSVPQDSSAGKRTNFDPNDVVIVRRVGEGQRPIFDRDEIRQALMEKGDGCFSERRVVAIMKERSRSRSPRMNPNFNSEYTGLEERENFMINSEHFNSYGHSDKGPGNTRPSLNDRWQKLEGRNLERNASAMGNNRKGMVSRDMGSGFYERDMNDDYSFLQNRDHSHSRSPDSQRYSANRFRDRQSSFVNERERRFSMQDEENDRYSFNAYDEESMQRQNISANPHDLRHSLSTKRRQSQESRPRSRYSPDRQDRGRGWDKERDFQGNRPRMRDRVMERPVPDTTTDSRQRDMFRDNRNARGASWDRPQDRDGRDLQGQGKLPNFSSRPDKYRYQEWLDKPDVVPKGPSYFEHDTRGEAMMRDSRGRGYGLRGRGRGMQSNRSRGGFRGRISYSVNPRNKWSPNHWKHDMFETSPERKPEQDNKPSSTTGNK